MSYNKKWNKRSNSGQRFEDNQPNCCGDNSCNRSGQYSHENQPNFPRGRSNNRGSGGHGDCCSGGNGNGQSSSRGQYGNGANHNYGREVAENRPGSGNYWQDSVRGQHHNEFQRASGNGQGGQYGNGTNHHYGREAADNRPGSGHHGQDSWRGQHHNEYQRASGNGQYGNGANHGRDAVDNRPGSGHYHNEYQRASGNGQYGNGANHGRDAVDNRPGSGHYHNEYQRASGNGQYGNGANHGRDAVDNRPGSGPYHNEYQRASGNGQYGNGENYDRDAVDNRPGSGQYGNGAKYNYDVADNRSGRGQYLNERGPESGHGSGQYGQNSGQLQNSNEHNPPRWGYNQVVQDSGRGPSNDPSSQETPGRSAREEFPEGFRKPFSSPSKPNIDREIDVRNTECKDKPDDRNVVDRNDKSRNEMVTRAKTRDGRASVDKPDASPTSARDLGTAKVTPSGGGEKSRKQTGHCPTCTCGKNISKILNPFAILSEHTNEDPPLEDQSFKTVTPKRNKKAN